MFEHLHMKRKAEVRPAIVSCHRFPLCQVILPVATPTKYLAVSSCNVYTVLMTCWFILIRGHMAKGSYISAFLTQARNSMLMINVAGTSRLHQDVLDASCHSAAGRSGSKTKQFSFHALMQPSDSSCKRACTGQNSSFRMLHRADRDS